MTQELPREEKLAKIRAYGLSVTETCTTPKRAGKQPRKIWEISGVNLRKYEALLRDQLDLKLWRGKFTAWADPVDNLLIELETSVPLSVEEIQSYAADRSEARADRLDNRAVRQRQEAQRRFQAANQLSDRFYAGQPILIGHHSEKSARADQRRMWNHMDRSIQSTCKAEQLESRAEGARQRSQMKTEYTLEYAGNRLKEAEAELNRCQREIAIHPRCFVYYLNAESEFYSERFEVIAIAKDRSSVTLYLERKNQTGEWDCQTLEAVPIDQVELRLPEVYRLDLENRIQTATERISYWREQVQGLGGDRFNQQTIQKGDYISSGFGLRKVVRVNAKSVTIETDYSWTETVPYHKIKRHKTAQDVAAALAARGYLSISQFAPPNSFCLIETVDVAIFSILLYITNPLSGELRTVQYLCLCLKIDRTNLPLSPQTLLACNVH